MKEKIIAIITNSESDLLNVLSKSNAKILQIRPEDVRNYNLDSFHSIAIIGGTSKIPLVFSPRDRVKIEKYLQKGKKIFSEFCGSISDYYFPEPTSTRFERLVFCSERESIRGINSGDLLEDQCNVSLRPYSGLCRESIPILQYININAHRKTDNWKEAVDSLPNKALWFDKSDNLLICSFRLCNFIRARFAPKDKWISLVKYIVNWLYDEEVTISEIEESYYVKAYLEGESFTDRLNMCIEKGITWFRESGILLSEGREGVLEGIATEIYPDGYQRILTDIRNDCTGEVSLTYFMNYMLKGDIRDKVISDNLASICFDLLQDKSKSHLRGMMRWSKTQWGVCYQDDVARVIIPQLLRCFYTGTRDYLKECEEALNFLVKTTGTDGTRVSRTDNLRLTEQEMNKLSSQPGNFPCVHHNGYYYAALLLAYKLTYVEMFREVAVKGISTIMKVYPETIREHSETQELCRLILPLSWLYWITREEEHKRWLYKVTSDLCRFKDSTGAFLEWDTGYKAHRAAIADNGECSLLSKNGDPIVDLLYSMNWLPIGFIQAYFATGDSYFKELWKEVARFMISSQIHSTNKYIHGGWARAFDVELKEVYGMPKDAGWGPWVMESGWTVAEILSGLIMGVLDEELIKLY